MKRTLTSKQFWLGVVTGAVVVPWVLQKTSAKVPTVKAQ